ncbi:MAG TPA: PepSY domain-containing protein [Nitrococcus sp.]|nr:PepSY domain-containing protein [Nitrococcus sp.]
MIMNGKIRSLMGVGVIALAMAGTATVAATLDGAQYLRDAKIKPADARTTALKMVGGKIIAEELEKEPGGSGLRYSFDIKKGNVIHEVGIDAETGKVLENSVEGHGKD